MNDGNPMNPVNNEFAGLENLSPQELEALIQAVTGGGVAGQKEALIAKQMRQAEGMQRTPMPEMRRYGDNHVVAPNPMEVAAAAIQQYRGGQQDAQAMGDYQGLIKQNAGNNEAYLRSVLNMLRRNQQPSAPPSPGFSPGVGAPGSVEGP